MILNVLEKNIFYYKNAIDDPYTLIENLERLDLFSDIYSPITKWNLWKASNSDTVYGSVKESKFSIDYSRNAYDLDQINISKKIKSVVEKCAKDYYEQTGINPDFLPDYYTINKYLPDVYMGPHVDYEGEGRTTLIPSISMVLYLNDNYEGGKIEFPEQGISIKPEAGSLIIFPSNKPYYHDPKPVTSGSKYMIPLFWFNT